MNSLPPSNHLIPIKTILIRISQTICILSLAVPVIAQTQASYYAGSLAGTGNYATHVTFVGYGAGAGPNGGQYNAFFGYAAGYSNRGGRENTFIGSRSGFYNNGGSANTFMGYSTGMYNANGANNTFFGHNAGSVNTASYNTFIGAQAGQKNTTGTYNTYVGRSAGVTNTTGLSNTFIGGLAGYANTTGTYNTFTGQGSGGGSSTGHRNSFFGAGAGKLNTSGSDNTFIGRDAGQNVTTGSGNTAIGTYAQQSSAALTNATAIGFKSIVTASNAMVLGSVNGQNGATTTIKVGIGTTNPGYNLHVNGSAGKPGGGSWTAASDKRLKKDIEPFREGLKEIAQVNPVWFRYNGKAGLPTEKRYVGIIAQEIQKIAPHTISEFKYENEGQLETYLDYDGNAMTYMLVNAVKELSTITNTLSELTKQQSEELKHQSELITKLQQEISNLKNGVVTRNDEYRSTAKLWQNSPNPYNTTTTIRYYIPEDISDAQIQVISMTGQEVYSRQLTQKGESEIEIPTDGSGQANQMLSAGNYVYQLVVNGVIADKKKMILSK